MEFLLISLFISKNGTIQCTQKSNKLSIFFLKMFFQWKLSLWQFGSEKSGSN